MELARRALPASSSSESASRRSAASDPCSARSPLCRRRIRPSAGPGRACRRRGQAPRRRGSCPRLCTVQSTTLPRTGWITLEQDVDRGLGHRRRGSRRSLAHRRRSRWRRRGRGRGARARCVVNPHPDERRASRPGPRSAPSRASASGSGRQERARDVHPLSDPRPGRPLPDAPALATTASSSTDFVTGLRRRQLGDVRPVADALEHLRLLLPSVRQYWVRIRVASSFLRKLVRRALRHRSHELTLAPSNAAAYRFPRRRARALASRSSRRPAGSRVGDPRRRYDRVLHDGLDVVAAGDGLLEEAWAAREQLVEDDAEREHVGAGGSTGSHLALLGGHA